MTPVDILVSLHKGYGLGDAVQMSAVLRHVAKWRPHWNIDFQAEEGRHVVGRGIARNTFAYKEPYPSLRYDAEVQIVLYDTWANWGDRPNTRVSSCLHERFGLDWDPECASYLVNVREESTHATQTLLRDTNLVAIHYEGDSSPAKKNLTHQQADGICRIIQHFGYSPVILDWRCRSPLPYRKLRVPAKWGGDAEMVCAIIAQCAAFIGIDSGPSKCASATKTPALVIWTGHHPAPFYDPAPNTTHLVPHGYHGLEPVCYDPGVIRFFEENYNVAEYTTNVVEEVKAWMVRVLQ